MSDDDCDVTALAAVTLCVLVPHARVGQQHQPYLVAVRTGTVTIAKATHVKASSETDMCHVV